MKSDSTIVDGVAVCFFSQNAAETLGVGGGGWGGGMWNKELSQTPSLLSQRRFVTKYGVPAPNGLAAFCKSSKPLHCPFCIFFYFSLTFCHLFTTHQ